MTRPRHANPGATTRRLRQHTSRRHFRRRRAPASHTATFVIRCRADRSADSDAGTWIPPRAPSPSQIGGTADSTCTAARTIRLGRRTCDSATSIAGRAAAAVWGIFGTNWTLSTMAAPIRPRISGARRFFQYKLRTIMFCWFSVAGIRRAAVFASPTENQRKHNGS